MADPPGAGPAELLVAELLVAELLLDELAAELLVGVDTEEVVDGAAAELLDELGAAALGPSSEPPPQPARRSAEMGSASAEHVRRMTRQPLVNGGTWDRTATLQTVCRRILGKFTRDPQAEICPISGRKRAD